MKHGKKFLELTKVEKTHHVLCLKEGIVFYDGNNYRHNNISIRLHLVEVYDHIDDSLTNMPSMNLARRSH